MGVTNNTERDFTQQHGLKRSGRIDLKLFQNNDDAGDGFPGLQKALRNWVNSIRFYPENENIYYVSTEQELNDALTSIGSGKGNIIITADITLTSTIDINISGTIIIEGQGDLTVIDCDGNRTAFNVTDCASLLLQNFKILCNDITDTTSVIIVNDSDDSKVVIFNVTIDGTGNGEDAYGITITSDNCIVKDCDILEIRRAFEIAGSYNTIDGNYIHDLDAPDGDPTGVDCRAVNITGAYNNFKNNHIKTVEAGKGGEGIGDTGGYCYGIYNTGSRNIIRNNRLRALTTPDCTGAGGAISGNIYGIYNTAITCIIDNNFLSDFVGGEGSGTGLNADVFCIYNTGTHTTMNNNSIIDCSCTPADSHDGSIWGIYNSSASHVTINNNLMKNLVAVQGGAGTQDAIGIDMINSLWSNISNNQFDEITPGGGVGYWGQDSGTSDYNIWTGNSAQNVNENITAGNNVEANNLP